MRYAAYIRISSEEQVGNFSVDAQRRAIEAWVREQGGKIVHFYIDEAESGGTADRAEFIQMHRDASKNKFDALIVHEFDRFARNRTDALAVKSLLRRDYGIKVFSTSEPSEDSDGAIGALIEGIMECVAEWYSRNLSEETTKGKKERATQGYHNNRAPFGYDKNEDKMLIPNDQERVGLLMAFELYATGVYSDDEVARELNKQGYRSKTGRPFSTDTVRDILQNRNYLGYVKYQQYHEHTNGSRSWANPVEWIKGKHGAIIPQELFDRCLEARSQRTTKHEYTPKFRIFLLSNIVYCAECVANMPADVQDDSFGKMRAQSNTYGKNPYYRCRAHDFGRECSQTSVQASIIEDQVVSILKNLKMPDDWRQHMVQSMGQLLGDKRLEDRIAEIKSIIERMDFRWDQGFITDKESYLEERVKLQQELEKFTPIPDDELEVAADMISNFSTHWSALEGDRKAQRELIQMIVA
jgi:site-specific DNA recombinase